MTDETRSSPGGPRQERKFATVLFVDIVGSTALAEREDPEVVQALIGSTFDRLVAVIDRFGGTPEKFIGDAVLAVFGVPAGHEDDSERAVRAALEMQDVLAEDRRSSTEPGRSLTVRIGVEAGELVVDRERLSASRDRMLTGDVVNTAARLQQVADPGQVVVGPNAVAATRWSIEYRELPPLALKGKAEPVRAMRAIRVKTSRPARPPLGLQARLVGREEEMGVLIQSFRRVVSEARPALVTILGPAGVGKSRLATELGRRLQEERADVGWLTGRCLAYGNVSYSALAEAVKEGCGILDDDATDEVVEKSGRAVEDLFGDRELVPMLEALVGSGTQHRFSREDLFDAWRRFLERMAARRALILALEDVHWADEGLLDFVDHVAAWAHGPILILTLARPELLQHRPSWGAGTRNYAAIDLDPLAPDEMRHMLEDLLSSSLPEGFFRTVTAKSEGNPLFGEEIVRMLIDRGVLRLGDGSWDLSGAADDAEVPRSVQALIAARLDSLPSDEKSALQDASVIGRTFWLGAVQRLSDLDPDAVRDALGRLRGKELLVPQEPSAFSGEVELSFRHALIRDAAYESLPKGVRAARHVELATWAEEQAGERSDEIAELLATHLAAALGFREELGLQDDRTLGAVVMRWAHAAGERARRLWQLREAARWFRTEADLMERMGAADHQRAAVWESYAQAAEAVEPYATVAAAFERALELYESSDRDADAGRVEAWLAHVAFRSGDERGVERWAARALARLEPLGDGRDLALALVHLGWNHHRHGRDREAEPLLRRAEATARRVGDIVVEGRAVLSLGMVVLKHGDIEGGVALLDRALELAREAGDLQFLLWALLVVSEGFELGPADYRRAESLVREGLDLASRAGHVEQIAWMQGNLADYLVDMGRLEEAEAPMREGLVAARSAAEPARVAYSLLMNAYVHALRGDLDESGQLLEELRPIVVERGETYHEGWAEVIQALIARAEGREAEAIDALVDGARRAGDRLEPWAGNLLLLECIRSLVRVDRADEAREFRERLAELAAYSASSRAFLAWADGLLATDPADASRRLEEAAGELDGLERRIEHGRCLVDVASAEHRCGADPEPTLARARALLRTCGATLFLREVDAAEPATGRPEGEGLR